MNMGNLIAAVFIATGQDVAALTECANGLLIVRPATREEIESRGEGTDISESIIQALSMTFFAYYVLI